MKMTAFWDIAPYSLVEVGRRFSGAYCLRRQGGSSQVSGKSGVVFAGKNVCNLQKTVITFQGIMSLLYWKQ
jgi:hypothetical protein